MPVYHNQSGQAKNVVGRHYIDRDGKVHALLRHLYIDMSNAARLVWELVSSCFGAGYWRNDKPWSNNDGWKN